MQVTKEDLILPTFLMIFGLALLVVAISREGLSGAIVLSMGVGSLVSFGMWLLARRTTYKRDVLRRYVVAQPERISVTPLLVFVVILISIVNGIVRLSFDTSAKAIAGSFIAVCLLGLSFTQSWELWYDWVQYKSRNENNNSELN